MRGSMCIEFQTTRNLASDQMHVDSMTVKDSQDVRSSLHVTTEHFQSPLETAMPSVSTQSIAAIERFEKRFRKRPPKVRRIVGVCEDYKQLALTKCLATNTKHWTLSW